MPPAGTSDETPREPGRDEAPGLEGGGARPASRTALSVAWVRAAHQVLDLPPRILDDPVVVRLLGPAAADGLRTAAELLAAPAPRRLRAHVLLRNRYAEDRLLAAVGRGIRSYLLLGAGLDTFAHRQPEWAAALRIVEVDHPASQADKRARLAAAGFAPPPNLVYAPIDFEVEALEAGLRRQGLWPSQPAFLSSLGVLPYLTPAAVEGVFRTVGSFPPSSEIAFTFASPQEPRRPGEPPSLADRAAAAGEPWLSFFEPSQLEAMLRDLGFSLVHFLTPAESAATYFVGRKDALEPPTDITIASARV